MPEGALTLFNAYRYFVGQSGIVTDVKKYVTQRIFNTDG